MGKTERVTVSFEVTRSRQYQTVKFGLSEEDDREAVVKAVRARLFKEVSDTAGKALEHVLAQQENSAGTP
jgi:hypothetical protein